MKRAPILLIAPEASRAPLLEELGGSFQVACASDSLQCEPVLREQQVRAIVVAFEAPARCIDEVLSLLDKLRLRVPLLALRDRHAEADPAWGDRVAVLRSPLLPDVLGRSVAVVLQLRPGR